MLPVFLFLRMFVSFMNVASDDIASDILLSPKLTLENRGFWSGFKASNQLNVFSVCILYILYLDSA